MKIRLIILVLVLLIPTLALHAQTGTPQIQEFYALVSPDLEYVYFDLFGMQAGTTIYLYTESDEFDTWLAICDIDCEEVYIENDDISADNLNSALQYTFPADGDYSVVVTDCSRSDVTGVFRLVLGFNAPNVLTGDAYPNGASIAVPYEPTYTELTTASVTADAQIQQFYGAVDPETEYAYYDIFGARAGQTIYLYAESEEIDTYLVICDIECVEVFAENDDIADNNVNSALQYTFPSDGDYSIAVTDCCSSEVTGTFRLVLGYNAPEVLTGNATPNGAEIAQEYEYNRVTAGGAERTDLVTCENATLTERPQLSGPELTVGTDNFLIHYTLEGEDSTTDEFVAEVLRFVEVMMDSETSQLGWPAPPRDCGEGGDLRFDFYLEEILSEGDILGYAEPGNVVGDNPNSSYPETWAAYSFMTIDNDFRGVESPLSVMRATLAHEFHHSIQFGYDIADAFSWYYESTASWIETQVSAADEDATGYTEAVFYAPDLCIGTLNEETGVRIYGEWLLIDSIAQDFGDSSIIRLWEYVADYEGMDGYYTFLDSLGTTPQDVLRRYAVRNLLRDYALGSTFPAAVNIESIVNGTGTLVPEISGVQEMSADYLLIRRKGQYTFGINNPNLNVVVVGIDHSMGQAQVFDLGQGGTVNTAVFDNAYVIILNNAQHYDVNACTETDWSLTVNDGSGSAPTAPNGEVFKIVNFIPAG